MSLTSYRAAPPRVRVFEIVLAGLDLRSEDILLADLAATYSPAP
jgi:hypothetical protein